MKPPPSPTKRPSLRGSSVSLYYHSFFLLSILLRLFLFFSAQPRRTRPPRQKYFPDFRGKLFVYLLPYPLPCPGEKPPVSPRRPKRFRFQGRRFSLRIMYSHAGAKRTLRPGIPHAARATRAKNQTVKGETRRNAPLCAKFPPCRSDSRRAPPQSRPPPIFSLRAKSALFARNRRKEGSRDATK